MRIALLFHKNPLGPCSGIDLARLRALALGLTEQGARVTVIAPVPGPDRLAGVVPVAPLATLGAGTEFDVVKACYHFSLELIDGYDGPLVCRLVRVVDESRPERDAPWRDRLLAAQTLAAERAVGLILNNRENMIRWRAIYGNRQKIAMIPTGCPADLPPLGANPYHGPEPVVLFLGSLAEPRQVDLLNQAAERLVGRMAVHFVGRNKTNLHGGPLRPLSPLVTDHGEKPEENIWDYVGHARVGLALAAGPDTFENDLSKIMAYIRGGLPVLGEERVPNLGLALKRGAGQVFGFGDLENMVDKAWRLANGGKFTSDPARLRQFIRIHSWSRRAEILHRFLRILVPGTIRGSERSGRGGVFLGPD